MTDQQTISTNYTRRELAQFFASIAVVSFVLHSIWEMSQMAAYKDLAGRPFLETAVRCTPATLGDVVITFWIYVIGALAAKTLSWGLRPRWNVYLTLALLGAVHAIWIEQAATASGRWNYTNSMPILPGFDVGLWPVLQLVILTPLVIWISSRYQSFKRRIVKLNPQTSHIV